MPILRAKLYAKLKAWNFCMPTIAERLLLVRGKTKQGEFAKLLNINPNTLRNYENGRVTPNQEILERVCVQFSVLPEWLLLGTGPMYRGEGPNPPPKHYSSAPGMGETLAQINERTTLTSLARGLTERSAAANGIHNEQFITCPQCMDTQRRLDVANERLGTANERLYEAMKENGALKAEIGKLREELASLKNEPPTSGGQTPMASAS